MSEFTNKPTYDEIFNELTILQMINSKLNNEVKRLRKNIQKIQDNQGLEICEYFDMCNSIRDTSDKFCFEDVEHCYEALKEYFGCSDPVQKANDYQECYKEIFGSESDSSYEADNELAEEKNIEGINTERLPIEILFNNLFNIE